MQWSGPQSGRGSSPPSPSAAPSRPSRGATPSPRSCRWSPRSSAWPAMYAMLSAHFLAAMQVLVYAGAIMTLFVFVVMVLNRDEAEPWAWSRRGHQGRRRRRRSSTSSFKRRLSPVRGRAARTRRRRPPSFGTVAQVGELLFTDYLFVFEAVSVLLLIAVDRRGRRRALTQQDDARPRAEPRGRRRPIPTGAPLDDPDPLTSSARARCCSPSARSASSCGATRSSCSCRSSCMLNAANLTLLAFGARAPRRARAGVRLPRHRGRRRRGRGRAGHRRRHLPQPAHVNVDELTLMKH